MSEGLNMGDKGKSGTKDDFQVPGLCTEYLVGPFTNGEKWEKTKIIFKYHNIVLNLCSFITIYQPLMTNIP